MGEVRAQEVAREAVAAGGVDPGGERPHQPRARPGPLAAAGVHRRRELAQRHEQRQPAAQLARLRLGEALRRRDGMLGRGVGMAAQRRPAAEGGLARTGGRRDEERAFVEPGEQQVGAAVLGLNAARGRLGVRPAGRRDRRHVHLVERDRPPLAHVLAEQVDADARTPKPVEVGARDVGGRCDAVTFTAQNVDRAQ